jgi:two-component system, LytTR family, sensor kinase
VPKTALIPPMRPALKGAVRRALPATRRGWWLWAGFVVGIGLLSFTRYHLAKVLDGASGEGLETFIDEMSAAVGAGVLFFGVRGLVRSYPLGGERLALRLPSYAAALLGFSVLHTLSNWGLRKILYPLAGLGDYDYGAMPTRFAMELPYDVIAFVIMATVVVVSDRLRAARERELRAARLESSLARAELRSLRLQLQPHFLFNALNTISSTMYDDPAAADEMIDRLAELLRASLRTAGADGSEPTEEVTLAAELEILDAYVALMKARFRDRLHVEVTADPDVREALVPPLLLQPLVENAVRHGGAERTGRGTIAIRAERADGELRLTVEDDGPGTGGGGATRRPGSGETSGLGLSATAERLQILYGEAHRFEAGDVPTGGFRVAIRLPFRTAGDVDDVDDPARVSDRGAA